MEDVNNNSKIFIVFVVLVVFIVLCFFIFKNNSNKDEDNKINNNIDVSDVNNINSVEKKLGSPIKITQSYLLNYTTKKSGVWYMSSAYVKSIKVEDMDAYIVLTNKDKSKSITASIEYEKVNVKKGDLINFVCTIDLEDGILELTKISIEDINYNSVTEIEFDDLLDNINKIKNNIFIINGYMVTDEDKYKLFDSKNDYKKNNKPGNYFTIEWKDEFNYTGNANVTISCKLGGAYKLSECELEE